MPIKTAPSLLIFSGDTGEKLSLSQRPAVKCDCDISEWSRGCWNRFRRLRRIKRYARKDVRTAARKNVATMIGIKSFVSMVLLDVEEV